MGRPKLTTEQWVAQAVRQHGSRYDYSRVAYTRYAAPVVVGCAEHGFFTQRENNHRNGAGCPQCGAASRQKLRAHSFEDFLVAAHKKHAGAYAYPSGQVLANSRSRVKIECPTHGVFEQMAYVHLNGRGCVACGYERNGKRSRLGISEFLRRAREVHGDIYEYLSGMAGMHKPMTIKCSQHGVFKQTAHNHLQGSGCPRCVSKVSKGEQELADFVRGLGVDMVSNSRKIIAPYELDIYVPEKRVAIEYHGLWFHREEVDQGKTKNKWVRCEQEGITLVQVFEDEWQDLRPQIEGRIKALLGIGSRLFARKCAVQKVPGKEATAFLSAHHTQGPSAATKAYGLYNGGILVALATFGPGRFGNTGWELLRYCSVGRVVGGVSKLVAAFRREHSGPVVSYADLRWGKGDGYAAAGFTFDSITAPDYWWADCAKVKRVSRYSVQPHKTGMPEKEYAEKHGLKKILGVGHKKWVLA